MKNLRKWTMADIEKALENVYYPEGCDYKDRAGYQYDAMERYAYEHGISMKGVPDGWNCPRSFMEWCPEE